MDAQEYMAEIGRHLGMAIFTAETEEMIKRYHSYGAPAESAAREICIRLRLRKRYIWSVQQREEFRLTGKQPKENS